MQLNHRINATSGHKNRPDSMLKMVVNCNFTGISIGMYFNLVTWQ